ncbi:hypothetical protein CN395_25080 [Priestia megaterium]|uniref:hypothetical protein n=1 Tax=Priestia megaterium TaxID=1404 RepID=UPI000BF792AC|nr:hypothetical protein [Priestia megaterium]PEU54966.1 hypothetical protein CN395_25080 [Priestia megaterium]
MFKQLNNKSRGIILGFLSLIIITVAVIAFSIGTNYSSKQADSQKHNALQEDSSTPKISNKDLEKVNGLTASLFSNFKDSEKANDALYEKVTNKYFSKDFLENVLPKPGIRDSLYGVYGYGRFVSGKTGLKESGEYGLIETGAIRTLEIEGMQKDNVHQAITVYVRIDGIDDNELHWIEWRNVPAEGWKIHAVSFDGNIEELAQPYTPKKSEY